MDTLQASTICDELLKLTSIIAVEIARSEIHRSNGDNQAAEGCRQMVRTALDQIEVRMQQLRALFQ